MIQTSPSMRILVAVEPVDFRRGIDGLAAICRQQLAGSDERLGLRLPQPRATAVKILVYDGQGFWLCQKRLSSGHFRWWPECATARTVPPRSRVARAALRRQSRDGSGGSPVAPRVGQP